MQGLASGNSLLQDGRFSNGRRDHGRNIAFIYMKYYVRDIKGRVAGPFSVEAIKGGRRGQDSAFLAPKLDSGEMDARRQCPDLFPPLCSTRLSNRPPPIRCRVLVHDGPLAVFLDIFKGGEDRFRDTLPWSRKYDSGGSN